MGLNELDSRHKKTTKVSDLSGFSVLGVADFAENSHQFGVDGGSAKTVSIDSALILGRTAKQSPSYKSPSDVERCGLKVVTKSLGGVALGAVNFMASF